MSEDDWRYIGTQFSFPDPNLMLIVQSPDTLSLNWVTENIAGYIIRLDTPIGENTQNIDLIERLSIKTKGLNPKLLGNAKSLEILILNINSELKANFYSDLYKIAGESLPKLNSIALKNVKGTQNTVSAVGKENILTLIKELESHP